MTLGYGTNTREFLSTEDDNTPVKKRPKCPILLITIQKTVIRALIDTGSEISAISEKFIKENQNSISDCPSLPLTGVSVRGATAGRAVKVTRQIFANITLDNKSAKNTLIIVPHLSCDCIIGIDFLVKLKTRIDLENYELSFVTPDNPWTRHKIKFLNPFNNNPDDTHQICEIKTQNDDEYDISDEEIDAKINSTNGLNPKELTRLKEVLTRHRTVFKKKPGLLNSYEHELRVLPHSPFKAMNYPVPITYRESVDQELITLMKQNVIQKSTSPYNSPLVVVGKKNGQIRLCLDARKINEILEADNERMETAEELFQECRSAKYISTLDLRSSFWQVPLKKESRKYTAFMHRGRCYEFKVTPFGLRTSTASLVRGLERVLHGLGFVINFVDDLLCTSETFEEHLTHLDELFQRFREHGLTLNLEKSQFFRSEAKFLGHILTPQGICPDPEKIRDIKEFPAPKNLKQLRGFLGLVNYYSKFTREHGEATVPLLHLLRKGEKWKWTSNEEGAFNTVKSKFCESVILNYPLKKKPFFVQTDASDFAVGAVLFQKDDNNEHRVLYFASRTLKGPEIGYNTTEKELLAIVWALGKFRTYLLGATVKIVTDHAALIFLRECRLAHARLSRWSLAIQDYHPTIDHCEGRKNTVADILSRPDDRRHVEEEIIIAKLAGELSPEFINLFKHLAKFQDEDPSCNNLKKLIAKEKKNTDFTIQNNILYTTRANMLRAVIPSDKIEQIISECHRIYGHAGSKKCYMILREDFFIPNLYRRIRKQIQSCDDCQRNKIYTQGMYAEMQNILPTKPGDLVSLDFYGPLPPAKYGNKHVLAVIDVFSKLTRLYPLKSATTDATWKYLINDYFPKYGKPRAILSDQGTQFTSKKWEIHLREAGITKIMTSIRHPQANPVERTNRELARLFRTLIPGKHNAWYDAIPAIEGCINETYHETTGYTPTQLHTGKIPDRPWKNIIHSEKNKKISHEQLIMLASENMKKNRSKRTAKFNASHKFSEFKVDDLVLARALNVSNPAARITAKFLPLYEGPYRIKSKIGKTSYIIAYVHKDKERGMYHTSDLRPYYESIHKAIVKILRMPPSKRPTTKD